MRVSPFVFRALAQVLGAVEDVVRELEKEIKGTNWGKDKRGFQQHMMEEDDVRLDWKTGKFEVGMACETCGDKNAWDRTHKCCETQCKGMINALQAFPFAAWDDISAAPLDPKKVTAARKLEIDYAERKPVWQKIPRRTAKEQGWKIIKSRWIDINKGDDENPNYRSRMVGKEFNDREIEGLFAATPPLEARRWNEEQKQEHPDCRCLNSFLRSASEERSLCRAARRGVRSRRNAARHRRQAACQSIRHQRRFSQLARGSCQVHDRVGVQHG